MKQATLGSLGVMYVICAIPQTLGQSGCVGEREQLLGDGIFTARLENSAR